MGFQFNLRDFAYPLALLKLKRRFNRNQLASPAELRAYQAERLRLILQMASERVPFYHEQLAEIRGRKEFDPFAVLAQLPLVAKEDVRQQPAAFTAADHQRRRAMKISTSGTTGEQLSFYVDKSSNLLEFVYYWRQWGWWGYSLGDRFAELSVEYFAGHPSRSGKLFIFEPLTRRLLLNSLKFSAADAADILAVLGRYRPRYIKGLPSSLYFLALLCRGHSAAADLKLRAVFSQGEMLLPQFRQTISDTFGCPVSDSYGQLERVAAVSQCPWGSYHLHSDYGLTEFHDLTLPGGKEPDGVRTAEIIGTSLHNFAMPLLRYRTRDLVRYRSNPPACPCGRSLPVVEALIGRTSDLIITPEGCAVPGLYVVFHRTPGVLLGRIRQEELSELVVEYAAGDDTSAKSIEESLLSELRGFVGPSMKIAISRLALAELHGDPSKKLKNVSSKIPLESVL